MNVLERIGMKHFDFEYHGEADMITSHYANWLANKSNDIKSYFNEKYEYVINSIDKLTDCFMLYAFSQYPYYSQNRIDLEMDNETKKLLIQWNEVLLFLQEKSKCFTKDKLIKYLNANAETFFKDNDKLDINLVIAIIKKASEYGSGTKIVFEKLMQSNYRLFLLRDFNNIKNVIIEDITLLDLFLKSYEAVDIGFNKLINADYLSAVSVISRKKGFDKKLIKPIIDSVVNFIKDICKENSVKNWIINKGELNKAIIFLHNVSYPNIAELQEKIKIYNQNENEYFEKHGHTHTGKPIDLSPHIKVFENPEIEMQQKLFLLTHENGKHFSNSFKKNQTIALTMLFNSANPTSETFSFEYQQTISMLNHLFSHIAFRFFNICDRKEIFTSLCGELCFISKQYKLFDYTDEQVLQDIQLLYDGFDTIMKNTTEQHNKEKDIPIKPTYYGTSMLLFSLIEKILNSIVKAGNKDIFLPKHLTLGELLEKHPTIPDYLKKVLGEPLFNYIKYVIYFEEDRIKQEKVGGNLRNIFAHYLDCYDHLHYGTVIIAFITYLSILNELAYKKAKKSEKTKTSKKRV